MINKKLVIATVYILLCSNLKAQITNKEVLNNYPAGVIAKLYDISKDILLSDSQQIQVARQIEISDNSIATDIKEGKTTLDIERTREINNLKIYSLLGQQVLTYTTKEAEKFAKIASTGEVSIYEDYKLDTFLTEKLRQVQFNKYKSVFQQYLLYQFSPTKAIGRVSSVAKRYDSLSNSIYQTIYSNEFITNSLKEVKKIKPVIADTLIQKMKKTFFVLNNKNNYSGWGETFLEVLQHFYPDTLITSHFYHAIINTQASYLLASEKYSLVNTYHISKSGYDSIYPLIKKKIYEQVLFEYTYGVSNMKDIVIKNSSRFYDSAIVASLLRDGSMLSNSQFAIALKYKDFLGLRPSLTDTLLWHAMYLYQKHDSILIKDPYAKSDFKGYEASQLNNLLTEDQYTRLLRIKNHSQAISDVEDDWDELEKRGLASNFVKEKTKSQLYNYYIEKWTAYYRFANDKLKQDASLRALKDNQPKVLTMLAAAKKQANPINSNTTLKLQW